MDVGPARLLRSPLVFQVGAEPHFPRLERFPTREKGRERETSICCFTYICFHWLILVCALTGDQARNLGTTLQPPDLPGQGPKRLFKG